MSSEQNQGSSRSFSREVLALVIPGAFSVSSILLQGMGLRYISASLSMMLSGSCIIFTAILSIVLAQTPTQCFPYLR